MPRRRDRARCSGCRRNRERPERCYHEGCCENTGASSNEIVFYHCAFLLLYFVLYFGPTDCRSFVPIWDLKRSPSRKPNAGSVC